MTHRNANEAASSGDASVARAASRWVRAAAAVAAVHAAACGSAPSSPPDGADAGASDGGGRRHPADGGRMTHPDAMPPSDAGGSEAGSTGLHVVMGTAGSPGHIVDSTGKIVQIHGADRSGTEYSCLYGSFFDGPADQGAIDVMKSWKVNAVRVPLNADCWLGINGAPAAYSGTNYQNAMRTWVNLITTNGMYAIVDLHWTAPASYLAKAQTPMADADHAPMFWSQVAATFASNGSVIFDLFNEPYITDWDCWLRGGMCAQWDGTSASGPSYLVAGMASLLQAVRKTGAENVVILGGLAYSSDMSEWVKSVNSIPTLPAPLDGVSIKNVAVSWHAYDFNSEQSGCPSQYNGYTGTCSSAAMTAMATSATDVLAAGFPLVIGETGISAFSASTAMPFSSMQTTDLQNWLDNLLTWADGQGQSYLAWSWNTDTPPLLLADYSGTPTPYFGATYQAHLKKF